MYAIPPILTSIGNQVAKVAKVATSTAANALRIIRSTLNSGKCSQINPGRKCAQNDDRLRSIRVLPLGAGIAGDADPEKKRSAEIFNQV